MPVESRRLLVILAGISGCAVDAADYPARLAAAECSLYEDCGLLEAFGGSYDDCIRAIEEIEGERVASESCSYSGAEARRCLRDLGDASCEDLRDSALEAPSPCEMVCAGS